MVLKEKLHWLGILGCVLCVVGSTTIVLHAPAEQAVESVEVVWRLATEPGDCSLHYIVLEDCNVYYVSAELLAVLLCLCTLGCPCPCAFQKGKALFCKQSSHMFGDQSMRQGKCVLRDPNRDQYKGPAELFDILLFVVNAAFLFYTVCVVSVVLLLIFHFVPRYGHTHIMVYIGICSLMGSLSVYNLTSRCPTDVLSDACTQLW